MSVCAYWRNCKRRARRVGGVAPEAEAAAQVGHLIAAGLEQLLGGERRAAVGMADLHRGFARGDFAAAGFQFRQGNPLAAGNAAVGPLKLLGGAHIEDVTWTQKLNQPL